MLEAQPDQVDFIVADLDVYTAKEIVALALNVDANLRANPPIGTPVDIGWARANWLPSIGEPRIVDSEARKPTAADVAARSVDAQQGLNEVLGWTPDSGPIFITNNVPYIGALNAGHSKQSPPGFVQDALELAVHQSYSAKSAQLSFTFRANTFKANKPRPTK